MHVSPRHKTILAGKLATLKICELSPLDLIAVFHSMINQVSLLFDKTMKVNFVKEVPIAKLYYISLNTNTVQLCLHCISSNYRITL